MSAERWVRRPEAWQLTAVVVLCRVGSVASLKPCGPYVYTAVCVSLYWTAPCVPVQKGCTGCRLCRVKGLCTSVCVCLCV